MSAGDTLLLCVSSQSAAVWDSSCYDVRVSAHAAFSAAVAVLMLVPLGMSQLIVLDMSTTNSGC
jgi:hypothetical protein